MEKSTTNNIADLLTNAADRPASETVSKALSHAKDLLSEAGPGASKIVEGVQSVVSAATDIDRSVFDHLSNLLKHGTFPISLI